MKWPIVLPQFLVFQFSIFHGCKTKNHKTSVSRLLHEEARLQPRPECPSSGRNRSHKVDQNFGMSGKRSKHVRCYGRREQSDEVGQMPQKKKKKLYKLRQQSTSCKSPFSLSLLMGSPPQAFHSEALWGAPLWINFLTPPASRKRGAFWSSWFAPTALPISRFTAQRKFWTLTLNCRKQGVVYNSTVVYSTLSWFHKEELQIWSIRGFKHEAAVHAQDAIC